MPFFVRNWNVPVLKYFLKCACFEIFFETCHSSWNLSNCKNEVLCNKWNKISYECNTGSFLEVIEFLKEINFEKQMKKFKFWSIFFIKGLGVEKNHKNIFVCNYPRWIRNPKINIPNFHQFIFNPSASWKHHYAISLNEKMDLNKCYDNYYCSKNMLKEWKVKK